MNNSNYIHISKTILGYINASYYENHFGYQLLIHLIGNTTTTSIFANINRCILRNPLLSDTDKSKILEMFSRYQRIVYFIRRKQWRLKLKQYKIRCDTDLCLEPLSRYKDFEIINIYTHENKSIHSFYYKDLFKICTNSLLECDHLFYFPSYPKNPYTNKLLKDYQLYQMYLHCKIHRISIPPLLNSFLVKCDLSLRMFELKNEYELQLNAVNEHIEHRNFQTHFNTISSCLNMYLSKTFILLLSLDKKKDVVKQNKNILLHNYMMFYYDDNVDSQVLKYHKNNLIFYLNMFVKKNTFILRDTKTYRALYKVPPKFSMLNVNTNTYNRYVHTDMDIHTDIETETDTDTDMPELISPSNISLNQETNISITTTNIYSEMVLR